MIHRPHTNQNLRRHSIAQAVCLLLTWPLYAPAVHAAEANLADAPVGVGVTSTTVKPNIAMVVDDSGSMGEVFMPDSISGKSNYRCFGFKGYNSMAYDPTYTYKPPYKPSGATYTDQKPRYPDAVFTAAMYDGYFSAGYDNTFDGSNNSATNLSTNKPFTNGWTGYYYSNYTGSSPTKCNSDSSYTAITSASSIAAPGATTGSNEAKTNYANWYSYYRQRAYTMKAAVGEAFSTISDTYRIGLFFINSTEREQIADFTTDKRTDWYAKLYAGKNNGSTPLRTSLAQMGRMYAGKLKGSLGDPVQYSCQQNFTILSTDGTWNDDNDPVKVDGSTSIGNVDGTAARPYLDTKAASNTLADTAYYYYMTDLRTEDLSNCENTIDGTTYSQLCDNNVLGTSRDNNQKQHMTTFTLGLGVSGTITYESDYETAANKSGVTQYFDILNGTADWPAPSDSKSATKTDDLWHAAVNGRGYYYSASNPTNLEQGLRAALAGVSARVGSSTAAATSNLEPVTGDNTVYLAKYRTVKWDGELVSKTIDPDTGVISSTNTWTSQSMMDTQVYSASSGDGRSIKYFNSAASNKLKDFTFTNLNTDGLSSYFTNGCTNQILSQCASLTSAQQTLADSGDNMVNFLRGRTTYEASIGATNPLFRDREHVLGDVVNSVPVYVKKPQFEYEQYDTTYATFKTDNTARSGNVYFGGNDGMLHAINTETGAERWAYVPSHVMPNMRILADTNYQHRYYVDGSPTAADICTNTTAASASTPSACAASSNWKTILVAGLNKGGCGYYALDITDPTTPKGLWEFTHANLGYSFGNPIVTRRKDGKWVVIISSGYNNIPGICGKGSGVGDGQGHIFVLDAVTGALLTDINTNAGSTSTPSNLGKLNAWVDNAQLNTADAVYGGDMLGNVWRFDFDDNHGASGNEATLIATLKDGSSNSSLAQPITTKPELAYIQNNRVIMVATGKLLATDDLDASQQQSLYALKDTLTSSSDLGNPRTNSDIKSRAFTQSITAGGKTIRTISGDSLNWSEDNGWYVDFTISKERVNVDMQLQYNILTAATNIPESNACTAGGYGWLYYLDIETGKALTTSPDLAAGYKLSSNSLVAGIKTVKLQNDKTVTIVTDTLGDSTVQSAPSPTGSSSGTARRTMWREIQD